MLDDLDERSGYAKRICPSCPHGLIIHRRGGGCHAEGCMCGWERRENGELVQKSTGLPIDPFSLRRSKRKGNVSKRLRPELMRIPCYFCGQAPENVDHLLPLSRGGTNVRLNLVSSCRLCNGMKGDMTYQEFIDHCAMFVNEVCKSSSEKRMHLHLARKEQAGRILAWHEKRTKSKEPVPVV